MLNGKMDSLPTEASSLHYYKLEWAQDGAFRVL